MRVTKIIAANGKPIKAGDRALKQNYPLLNGISKELRLEINFSNPMNNYTIQVAYQRKIGDRPDKLDSVKENTAHWHFYNDSTLVFKTVNQGTGTTQRIRDAIELGNGNMIFVGLNYSNYSLLAKDRIYQDVLTKSDDSIFYNELIQDPSILQMQSINKLVFNALIGDEALSKAIIQTRLVIFDRVISERELNYLFNNGNYNSVLSTRGLVAEYDFSKASIVTIEGVDYVGFQDQSNSNNHAKITSPLPVGTLAEQVTFVNENKLVKWLI